MIPEPISKVAENLIEIRVNDIAQLFHTLDPFPFREKDLADEAEDYIVSWAREMPGNRSFKIVVFLLAHLAGSYLTETALKRLAEESFLILGWVANWRPLEIFLYDWWPLARRRDLYNRLSVATVESKPYSIEIETPSLQTPTDRTQS